MVCWQGSCAIGRCWSGVSGLAYPLAKRPAWQFDSCAPVVRIKMWAAAHATALVRCLTGRHSITSAVRRCWGRSTSPGLSSMPRTGPARHRICAQPRLVLDVRLPCTSGHCSTVPWSNPCCLDFLGGEEVSAGAASPVILHPGAGQHIQSVGCAAPGAVDGTTRCIAPTSQVGPDGLASRHACLS